ncbi:hypothetical protein CMUST_10560 [Corynebacterium mustelae]|uniref:Uncharacterized protein n=1 Tax=Corynebacterium mustelae TaxID=571915 RepID=A0A0G3H3M1_9CORY|nr:hypothetical protein [Corynebacterium mustelae]AKK06428.1 hypothetical protein CMUST_10560 [Corynebacterium mustelae]
MIRLHYTQHPNDAPLVAVTYTAEIPLPPVIRLVAEPLIEAESLYLDTFGLKETTRHNCGFTPKRAAGFPAWPILTDPGNAKHALDLMKELQWVRRQAKHKPGNVKQRIGELAEKLQGSVPHFIPTFFEEVARIFIEAENLNYAKQFFTKAREVERTHALVIDNDRHAYAFDEFAGCGVVGAKTFTQESRDAAARMTPHDAYDYFFRLLIDQCKAGAGLYANALKDLHFLGKKAGLKPRDIDVAFTAAYLPTRSFPHSSEAVLARIVKVLPALVKNEPELAEIIYTTIPDLWNVYDYVTVLQGVKLWEPLCADSEKFASWIATIVDHHETNWKFFHVSHVDLLNQIVAHKDVLEGTFLPLSYGFYHLDYLDAFSAAGIQWVEEAHIKQRWKSKESCHCGCSGKFEFSHWCEDHHRDLGFLVEQDKVREALVASIPSEYLATKLDALFSSEPVKQLISLKLTRLREFRSNVTGSKELWADLDKSRKHLHHPRLRALYPELIAEILHIDPAAELAERLRRGTLVEYIWPTFESHIQSPRTYSTNFSSTYPWVCVKKREKLTVFSGEKVREFAFPHDLRWMRAIPTDDDVFLLLSGDKLFRDKWMWVNDGTVFDIKPEVLRFFGAETVSAFEGTVYFGKTPIRNGDLSEVPSGFQLGFGPVYAIGIHVKYPYEEIIDRDVTVLPGEKTISGEAFHEKFRRGELSGLDLPQVSAVATKHNAEIDFKHSFTATVTEQTTDSPFGVEGDRLFSIALCTKEQQDFRVSPLGVFATDAFVIKRPSEGVWYLDNGVKPSLIDAETGSPVAGSLTDQGVEHILNDLPLHGFHFLRPRNEQVSARMRSCSYEQAAELLANPLKILDFASGDETLAAAIAGIIVEISNIHLVSLKLPQVESVPAPLHYLYKTVQPVEVSEQEIPEPPNLDSAHPHKDFAVALVDLASILGKTRNSGNVHVLREAQFIFDTIGREKLWLAWLASPVLSLDMVRSYHALLSWCVQHGVLGVWRRRSFAEDRVFADMRTRWVSSRMFLGYHDGFGYLWNPSVTSPPDEPVVEEAFDDELFMPSEKFTQALDKILTWHENRHVASAGMDFSWTTTTVTHAAEDAASVTSLPPHVWALLFAGVCFNSETTLGEERDATLSQLLGLPATTIRSFPRKAMTIFDGRHAIFHALAWHDGYLEEGPSITNLRAAWESLWGPAWIHLSDEMWDQIPASLQPMVDAGFHSSAPDATNSRYGETADLLSVYLHLAHLVEPGSASAQALAMRLQHAIEDPDLLIHRGLTLSVKPFTDRQGKPLPSANKGTLDALLTYLTQGTPIVGFKQDPQVTAPDVVSDAAKTLNLTADAARYFLQLLALPNPTDANIQQWNSWDRKHLNQVIAELASTDLVVQAQRAGSGRSVFLPGPWYDVPSVRPALEAWKTPHYLLWEEATNRPLVKTCPPLLPYPELFHEVWQRYKTGDSPQYEPPASLHNPKN